MSGLPEEKVRQMLEHMSYTGLLEWNFENDKHEKQWLVPMFVPGSGEFSNMNKDLIEEHPELEEVSRELETAIAGAEKEWRNGTTGRQAKRLQGYLRGGQAKSFDNYAQQRIRELRDKFRADNAPSF